MQTGFLKDKLNYDGSQLRSHFAYNVAGMSGNACIAFIGGCDVTLDHMVDLVDKKTKCKIYSEKMLHFIIEHFDGDLVRMIMRQRLLVAVIGDLLKKHKVNVVRKGNDLYDGDAKINVSIATASPVSCLMHIGINISSKNTPVKTKGLEDYKIDPVKFAEEVMKAYIEELDGIATSRCKVRGVE